jgi:hypothetical protein
MRLFGLFSCLKVRRESEMQEPETLVYEQKALISLFISTSVTEYWSPWTVEWRRSIKILFMF